MARTDDGDLDIFDDLDARFLAYEDDLAELMARWLVA